MRDDIKEFLCVLSAIAAFAMLALSLISLCFTLLVAKPSCYQYGDVTGLEARHFIISGCFVEIDGQWMKQETAETIMSNDFRVSQKGES